MKTLKKKEKKQNTEGKIYEMSSSSGAADI